jgi:hypothetical protein
MKKVTIIFIVLVLFIIGLGIYKFNFTNDDIYNENGEKNDDVKEVKSFVLSETEARVIAEKSCIKGGEVLSAGTYNSNSKTWWYDANLNATREGCNPACVVNEETKTAEINWRCTGIKNPAEKPVACTMDAKQCPDGSYVGRIPPNCDFQLCSQ